MKLMKAVQKVIDQLYKNDREVGTMHDYEVVLRLQPNLLDYDGCDSCSVEVRELKKEFELKPTPHDKIVFEEVIFESKHHCTVEEALDALAKQDFKNNL